MYVFLKHPSTFVDSNSKLGAAPLVCVDAESLGPEGTMIGYTTKKKERTKNINLIT